MAMAARQPRGGAASPMRRLVKTSLAFLRRPEPSAGRDRPAPARCHGCERGGMAEQRALRDSDPLPRLARSYQSSTHQCSRLVLGRIKLCEFWVAQTQELLQKWDDRARRLYPRTEISGEGLMLGAGTVLAGMARDERGRPRLALDDEPRASLALLATAYDRPAEAYVLAKISR